MQFNYFGTVHFKIKTGQRIGVFVSDVYELVSISFTSSKNFQIKIP